MKTDGRLALCPLKGTLGDALHAVLCGCGRDIRLILAHLRGLVAAILSHIPRAIAAAAAATRPAYTSIALTA
jgi:IS5 family transposase